MKLICKNRGMGKTYDLIKMSAETGYRIVVHSDFLCRVVSEKAKEMNLDIPSPISKKQMNLSQFNKETFLIDELELFIESNSKVYAATINKENVLLVEDDVIPLMDVSLKTLIRQYNTYVNKGNFNTALNIMKNIDMLSKQIENAKQSKYHIDKLVNMVIDMLSKTSNISYSQNEIRNKAIEAINCVSTF